MEQVFNPARPASVPRILVLPVGFRWAQKSPPLVLAGLRL